MKIFGFTINPLLIILVGVLISGIYLIASGFESALGTLAGWDMGLP